MYMYKAAEGRVEGRSVPRVGAARQGKQWALKTADGGEIKKAAGVEKGVTDTQLRFEHYARVAASGQTSDPVQTMRVQSDKHVLTRVLVVHRLTPLVSVLSWSSVRTLFGTVFRHFLRYCVPATRFHRVPVMIGFHSKCTWVKLSDPPEGMGQ